MASDILQWHDGFHAALQIEFLDESISLEFHSEHELYKKALRIDTLIIKKSHDTPIQKNIGKIFRKYNLIEYKSPDDYLSINDFYKVYGYACLYQSNTRQINEISMSDITITFVCSHYPRKMLRILKNERDLRIEQEEPGIYLLKNDPLPIQIILINQLSPRENRWLSSLTRNLPMNENTKCLLREYNRHKKSNLYQAAMDLIMQANQKSMEDCSMVSDIIKEIFADEWKEKELQIQQKESQIQQKESQIQQKESQMQQKESQIRERELQLQKEEENIAKRLERRERRMNSLIQRLLHDNLLDDLKRASEDNAYLEKMYQRYGL